MEEQIYQQLVRPWKFKNTFGIPEVAPEDIQIGDWIGSGKKGTTYQATWKGQQVALKKWSSQYELAQWELERYCDLIEQQGSLIPMLYFVVRTEDKMMFGLQLGQHATDGEPGLTEAMDELDRSLRTTGWRQRESSWRADNVVWMTDDGGTKRLVAIDLESFIPWKESPVQECTHHKSQMTPLGIPYVGPGEVDLGPTDPYEGPVVAIDRYGFWGTTRVTTIVYPLDYFRQAVADLMIYQSLKPRDRIHIPQPLFLTRFRSAENAIIVGYRHCEQAPRRGTWLDHFVRQGFNFCERVPMRENWEPHIKCQRYLKGADFLADCDFVIRSMAKTAKVGLIDTAFHFLCCYGRRWGFFDQINGEVRDMLLKALEWDESMTRVTKHVLSFLGNVDSDSVQVSLVVSQSQGEAMLFTVRQYFDEHFRAMQLLKIRERQQELINLEISLKALKAKALELEKTFLNALTSDFSFLERTVVRIPLQINAHD